MLCGRISRCGTPSSAVRHCVFKSKYSGFWRNPLLSSSALGGGGSMHIRNVCKCLPYYIRHISEERIITAAAAGMDIA